MEGARTATPDDLPELVALARAAVAALAGERGASVFLAREARGEPASTLAADLADPAVRVLVGTIEGQAVGYAAGRVEDLRDGRRLGIVADLFVEEEAREVGVGEALLDALITWFAEQGCQGIDALALPGGRATKNFFEGAGFTARLLVLHHRLEEGP